MLHRWIPESQSRDLRSSVEATSSSLGGRIKRISNKDRENERKDTDRSCKVPAIEIVSRTHADARSSEQLHLGFETGVSLKPPVNPFSTASIQGAVLLQFISCHRNLSHSGGNRRVKSAIMVSKFIRSLVSEESMLHQSVA